MIRDSIRLVGSGLIAILIVTVAVSGVSNAILNAESTNQTAIAEIEGGSGDIPGITTVEAVYGAQTSLNDSVRLSGGDSTVSFSTDVETNGTWSVCSFSQAKGSVVSNNEQRIIIGVDDLVVSYNGSSDSYRAWYYNESRRTGTDVTISAPSPGDRTLLCAQKNSTHLKLSRNTTGPATTALTSGGASDPVNTNWNGTVDEVRLWQADLNGTQRQHLHSSPTVGVPGVTPGARVSFDVYSRTASTVPVHFSSGSADLENALLVDGIPGQRLTGGSDFSISDGEVFVLDSGKLTGSGDVVFLDLSAAGLFFSIYNSVIAMGRAAIGLLVVGVLIIAANRLTESIGGGGL